jgi:hypothetical protein
MRFRERDAAVGAAVALSAEAVSGDSPFIRKPK